MPATSRRAERFKYSLAQRTRRFAFEIENDEVLPGIEGLPEMIIAVSANLRGIRFSIEQAFLPLMNFFLRRQNLFGFLAKCFRQVRNFLL